MLKNIVKLFMTLRNIILMILSRLYKRDNNVWVFGEWFGKRCGDNCAHFANYVSKNHPEISCVWIVKAGVDTNFLNQEIKVLEMDSKEAINVLKHSGVFVMGQNFFDFSSQGLNIFGRALTINLWHGAPFKRVGHDGGHNKHRALNKIYNKLFDIANNAKLFVCPSELFSDIWKSAFGVSKDNIIYAGQPRNSILYDVSFQQYSEEKLKEHLKIAGDKKIIAHLPTFREGGSSAFSFLDFYNDRLLMEILSRHNAVVVEKHHFASATKLIARKSESFNMFLLEAWDTQSLLSASDLLITDYSSVFFDYLILDRPIINISFDYEQYRNADRGLYFPMEDVACGHIARDFQELLTAIDQSLNQPDVFKSRRAYIAQKFTPLESPHAMKFIYHEVTKKICCGS